MTETDRTFWVHYSRDDNGMWLAEVYRDAQGRERLGVATHGRTLVSTEANVREALALWFDVDDGERFTLVPRYPEEIVRASEELNATRDAARRAEHEAIAATARAARALAAQGLGLRDVGALLGLSHQRVQQLLATSPEAPVAVRGSRSAPNPFAALRLTDRDLIAALALLAVIGFIAWDRDRKGKPRLLVKTPPRPLPAFAAKPDVAQVYDFTRALAKRQGGSVPVPAALAAAVEDRARAM